MKSAPKTQLFVRQANGAKLPPPPDRLGQRRWRGSATREEPDQLGVRRGSRPGRFGQVTHAAQPSAAAVQQVAAAMTAEALKPLTDMLRRGWRIAL
jgi:hypothetical protein